MAIPGQLNWSAVAVWMAFAQVSDVVFLFLLPVMLKTLATDHHIHRHPGLAQIPVTHRERYSILALECPHLSAILHGVCYDFLFIAKKHERRGE